MDIIFGDIRKFITEEILEKYDRIGVHGHSTLYRNTPEINAVYRQVGDIRKIFVEQSPFAFDEWGHNNGTSPYWQRNFANRLWQERIFDDLDPYHYSFISGRVRRNNFDIRNVMFSFNKGLLYRIGTKNGKVDIQESFYVHLQKRPIIVDTEVTSSFSIIPPGKYIPYVESVTPLYLKWHIRDSSFWAYYVRARNKLNKWCGLKSYSNMVLCPNEEMRFPE